MTRLLVLSDIHGCVPAVEAMVRLESGGRFDAAVVAGDIGPSPEEFFRAFEPLGRPVLYVYGNWDHAIPYDHRFAAHAIHLQGAAVVVGDLHFVGFSGCEVHWGQNPHLLKRIATLKRQHRSVLTRLTEAFRKDEAWMAPRRRELAEALERLNATPEEHDRNYIKALKDELFPLSLTGKERERVKESAAYRRYSTACAKAWTEVADANREEVFKRVRRAKLPRERTVLVTHERQYRLQNHLDGLGAHLFGHRHGFKVTRHAGIVCVNVSCLDPVHTVFPKYGVINWSAAEGFRVEEKDLPVDDQFGRKCRQYYREGLRQDSEEIGPRLDWLERLSIAP